MLENKFDEIFRNKLLGHTSQVPEDMWERIRQKDKDRKPFPFWPWRIIGPALLVFGLAGVYFLVKMAKKTGPTLRTASSTTPAATLDCSHPRLIPTNSSNHVENLHPQKNTVQFTEHSKKYISRHKNGSPISLKRSSSHKSIPKKTEPGYPAGKDPYSEETETGENNKFYISHASKKEVPVYLRHKPYKTLSYPEDNDSLYPKRINLKQKYWHLDLYISPDLPILSINSNLPIPGREVLQQAKFSYTAGLKVTKSFSSHITGQIGLQYSQVNIKFSKSDSLFSVSGDRQLNSLDIPLLVGYEMGNDRFRTAINAGIILNAWSWNKGSYQPPGSNPYRQNTGPSLYLGLGFTYALDQKFSVFAEPYYRYRTSNVTNDHQLFTQKINSFGVSFGIRYNFNRNRQHK